MMKSICLALTLASAAAFAPSALVTKKQGTALNEFARGYVGNEGPEPMAPIFAEGSKNFDPAGFCEVRTVRVLDYIGTREAFEHAAWVLFLSQTIYSKFVGSSSLFFRAPRNGSHGSVNPN
jgi:hypothetical protein